jgi:ferredoxin/rubrerythrin
MANVTFSSPSMARDITVYAVAGHRGTILAVAKAHKIPIAFNCQDGECGSCIVEVKHVSPGTKHGIMLTDKEKELLRQHGKITREEIAAAEVNDMPPRYRLACQCFIRDEDIIVSFEGDPSVPSKPARLPAIETLEEFYGLAAKVEEDAALHLEALAAAMERTGHRDVADFFLQLSKYSRSQLNEAKELAGKASGGLQLPAHYVWPHHATPGQSETWAGDPALTRLGALRAALQGERRGLEFYCAVADTSANAKIAAKAREFVTEVGDYVAILERWIAREEAVRKAERR